jgi:hypothetical protein
VPAHGLGAHPKGGADPARRLVTFETTPNKFRSTQGRQARILMTVHLRLPRSLKSRNSSFLGLAQMDNLLKAHSWGN